VKIVTFTSSITLSARIKFLKCLWLRLAVGRDYCVGQLCIRASHSKRGAIPEAFASERLLQTLLFGDEKGEEEGQRKDFAKYLDGLMDDEARQIYERKTREYFHLVEKMPYRITGDA